MTAFSFTLAMFGILVFFHWECILISFLTVNIKVLPFKNVEDLSKVKNYKVLPIFGSSLEDAFSKSKNSNMAKNMDGESSTG